MLKFLANIVEQLDLASEHLAEGDANNARFGLMLTDNVVEIMLHQLAKDKQNELRMFSYRGEEYQHAAALQRALGQHFDSKVRFAKLLGKLSDESGESILIFHSFRNEVYHIGVQHEAVLPTVADFYFKVACDFLGNYVPPFLSWGSDQKLPERAQKFFSGHRTFPGTAEQFQKACLTLGAGAADIMSSVAEVLADHMEEVVEDQDTAIDLAATGGPNQRSRDEVIVDCQAWTLAFSEEGKKFTRENGWPGGSVFDHVKWIAQNYPLKFRRDPIPAWVERVEGLRREQNPHGALKKYRAFMDQTADIREKLDEAARAVDAYIDGEIKRMRGG
jgi:hypothetical protein